MVTAIRSARIEVRRWSVALVEAMSVQDFVLGVYLVILGAAVLSGAGPDRVRAEQAVLIDLIVYGVGLAVTRGELIPRDGLLGATLYRLFGPVVIFLSYFQLRLILPTVSSAAYDLDLYALDLAVFGVEPAVAWDHLVTPARTEWFSFFYLSYFGLLAAYLSSMTFLCRDQARLSSFALGVFLLFTIGQLLYMVVPGYGPYAALSAHFTRPLEGPTYWALVDELVTRGGALKDIFPSLHTAVPTFFALYSWRHRDLPALRWLWPVVALVASQIVLATMYLRWHYLIDVVAGLTLAVVVDQLSARVGAWEVARRAHLGRPPVFEPLPGTPGRP
jgi:hypothetical protein